MYLTQGLHRSLQRHAGKLALRHLGDADETSLDVASLVQQVARLAAALQACGVAAGDRVALLSPNNHHLVQQLLACWWLGAVVCPLNTRWSATDLHHAVANCGASLLLVDPGLALLSAQAGLASALKAGGRELDSPGLASQAAQRLPLADSRTGGDALAALLHTGGSSGQSKGVMLTHANFWAAAMARMAALNNPPEGVTLLVAPLFHVAGLGRLVTQLIAGSSCLTLAQFRPEVVMAAIAGHGVSDILLVPTMLQSLLDHPGFDASRLQGLRRIAFGAAPMPPTLLARALVAWPEVEFVQAYGMTETAATVCINLPPMHRPGPRADAATRKRQGSVGQAGLAVELRIVDEQGIDRPAGQVGEILVRGPMVMQGYWQRPEATALALQDGWLRTGDAGRIDEDGYLFIADRIKDMIITGGENVYSAEVEAVLRLHPAVADVAVVGVPHPVWGEAVHAVVVLASGALPQPNALRRFCRKQLAGYKCPRSVSFASSLPFTAAGKVQKAALRETLKKQMAKTPL